MRIRSRFHRGRDAWARDSYGIPGCAVLGASDTGTWSDSPCNSNAVKTELNAFRQVLRAAGIQSRWGGSSSGNVFCRKRWIMVAPADWDRAITMADAWLHQHEARLRFCHDARA